MTANECLERSDDLLAKTTAILADLVGLPTVSCDGNLAMIAYLAERLEAAGGRTRLFTAEDGRKANLIASFGPEGAGGVALSGHTDVVPVEGQNWSRDPFALHDDGERLFGRGACDMKGFIAACVAQAPLFGAVALARPLQMMFTYDEEVGCLGARALMDDLARLDLAPDAVIVGEPTEMRVIEGHKGCYEYTTRFSGRAGHASRPDFGVNAVEYAVRFATRLMDLREGLRARAPAASRFDPPWTTVSIGRIAGGEARNIIASWAEVEWEMRPVRVEDAAFVKQALDAAVETELLPAMRAGAAEADIATEIIGEVAGLEPASDNEARRIAAALTGEAEAGVVGFGAEAGLFQALGASAVVCGPGSIEQAHKPDEFIAKTELSRALAFLDGLARRMIAPPAA